MHAQRETDGSMSSKLHAKLIEGMPVTDRRIELAGFSTPVLETGEGPPVILLHGQGGFGAMWGPVLMVLSGSHRVIAPDVPGLGRSRVTTGTLDEDGVIAWLDDLIARTCDQPPILVGHSLGGSIALRFATRYGPRLDRIILINSGSLAPFRPSLGLIFTLIRMAKRPDQKALKRLQRHVFVDPERVMDQLGPRRVDFENYQLDRAADPDVSSANRQLLRRIATAIPTERLREIQVPVSLIWGREDKINRFAVAEEASKRFGWMLYPIDDAAHIPMAEQPASFVGALSSAISSEDLG